MSKLPIKAPRLGKPRRLRLWHLSVAVLTSALLFALVRAMMVGHKSPDARDFALGVVACLVMFVAAAAFVWGVKLGNRVSLALLRQGEDREGLGALATSLFAIVAFLGIILVSLVIGALIIVAAVAVLGLAFRN